MTNRIYNELKKRFEEAGFEPITITMKCNNDRIVITPCYYGLDAPKRLEDVEYFLVDSSEVMLYGNDTLMKVADTIAHYQDFLKETDEGIEQLKAHIRKHGKNSDWDFVSDYHKDLFGHRPHVGVGKLIQWAFSDSKNSARFF